MKTRKEIYSNEAAEMLRCITIYHNIRKPQLIKLFPETKPDVIEKLIFHLQNNRRIFHNKKTDIIYDNDEHNTNFETINCLWVLCDFIEKTDFHSSSDFPINLIFFSNDELYEISYVAENKEAIYEQAFNFLEATGKRIIVLENNEQISKLNIPDVTAYCTVNDETGEVKYFKSE